MFDGIYKNRRVLVSGHTGFKGSWLCKWLNNLGAEVYGYSLLPNTEPNHFDLSNPSVNSCINNIIDFNSVKKFVTKSEPEIIFHLAAQPSVLKSYEEPIETFTTNIIGTSNFLEVARYTPSVKAIIIITTDKCYKNKEWVYGYRENDELGGHDPYSASKACAELVTESFRKSFTNKKNNKLLIASARAGNVLGGGDWTNDRIFKDIAIAISKNKKLSLRNPNSVRPWQHVLEPLHGYLILGEKLLNNKLSVEIPSWNFGPNIEKQYTVEFIASNLIKQWGAKTKIIIQKSSLDEAGLLMLNNEKAKLELGWKPKLSLDETIQFTYEWYYSYFENKADILKLTEMQIDKFLSI